MISRLKPRLHKLNYHVVLYIYIYILWIKCNACFDDFLLDRRCFGLETSILHEQFHGYGVFWVLFYGISIE